MANPFSSAGPAPAPAPAIPARREKEAGREAGEDYRGRALKLLRPAGQYVAINGSPGMWLRTFTIGHSQGQHLVLMKPNTADLQLLADLLGKGEIKPVLAKTLPFTKEAVQEGFQLLQSRRTVGKITFII